VPLKTEETFQLRAPADRVWSYLIDPRHVVSCLPGAELTSVQDESTFLGKVKVKVGPVVAAYSGKVVITERDDAARVVRMVGEGKEGAGGGSAKVAITSTVVELPGGITEVRVTADLDIVGRIAQFGRGMIESVNKQMFRQFADCVRATLESQQSVPVPAPAAAEPGPGNPRTPAAASEGRLDVQASGRADASPSMGAVTSPAFASADNTRFTPAAPPGPQATAQPVRLLPVLGRALWEMLAGLARRIFGRRSESPR
jgi:carbon monoxide dehydrogenase subunit G